jgi:cytochrome c biogenesis protein
MNFSVFRYFTSLKLAISLLLIIALFSIIGTVIEQGQSVEFYKINYSDTFYWNIFLTLGLDHVYQTWWYITSLILLGVCLISCTFFQQFPTLKIARKCFFQSKPRQFKKQKLTSNINKQVF